MRTGRCIPIKAWLLPVLLLLALGLGSIVRCHRMKLRDEAKARATAKGHGRPAQG
jgi:hypothetical protein